METSPSLTDFLLARIAEDETVASVADRGPWVYEVFPEPQFNDHYYGAVMSDPSPDGSTYLEVADGYTTHPSDTGSFLSPENGEHIARHDPARVLAECEAKRQIVEEVAWQRRVGKAPDATLGDQFIHEFAEGILSLLALPYADHPDYREEWRP